jgi:hypothetical protein
VKDAEDGRRADSKRFAIWQNTIASAALNGGARLAQTMKDDDAASDP